MKTKQDKYEEAVERNLDRKLRWIKASDDGRFHGKPIRVIAHKLGIRASDLGRYDRELKLIQNTKPSETKPQPPAEGKSCQ